MNTGQTMKNIIALTLTGLVSWSVGTTHLYAENEAGPIQFFRGDRSPTIEESNVNDYTYQDEQVNLGPDDEDVLVLRVDEKILLNRYITATFPINHVTPREIRRVFRELTAKEGGRAEVIRDKKTGENYLQVVAPKWMVPFIADTVKVIDKEWLEEYNNGSGTIYYKAKHRNASIVNLFALFWGGEGFSTVDDTNNSILRYDEPYRLDSFRKGAELVDIPEHQGQFRIKVYEIATQDDLKLGLDYVNWKNGPGRNLFGFGSAGYYISQRSNGVEPVLGLFNNVLDQTIYRVDSWAFTNFAITAAYIDFLASKGKAKTLAEGTVQVRSGEIGTFNATDQIVSFDSFSFYEDDIVDDPEGGLNPSSFYRGEAGHMVLYDRYLVQRNTGEVGINVYLRPVIMSETTELEVVADVSSVSGYSPNGLPIINRSETSTKVRVKDGSVLLLSGLTRTEEIETKSGMPFLSSIPVLGYLFGGEQSINREKQIVIVVESETERGGSVALENPEEVYTAKQMVTDENPPAVPKNNFGFDMWLLDGTSGGEY